MAVPGGSVVAAPRLSTHGCSTRLSGLPAAPTRCQQKLREFASPGLTGTQLGSSTAYTAPIGIFRASKFTWSAPLRSSRIVEEPTMNLGPFQVEKGHLIQLVSPLIE
ncbi:hypothetical protein [Paenibacillus jilunlii]|uniref:hypothetical protein n=1 Tax=Paenibacillus jilunlii TaxID=682956 RepID=UPI0012F72220|nr:hypothetical protein [Paenibacillus jilunlii]